MNTYEVWRIQNVECAPNSEIFSSTNEMIKTNHTIKARTQKEAEYKLRRKFKNAGFHLMGLIVRNVERELQTKGLMEYLYGE